MDSASKSSENMTDAEFDEAFDLEAPRYEIWLSCADSGDNTIYSAKVGDASYDDPESAVKDAEDIFKALTKDALKKYPGTVSATLTVDEVVDCEGEEMTIGAIFSKTSKK